MWLAEIMADAYLVPGPDSRVTAALDLRPGQTVLDVGVCELTWRTCEPPWQVRRLWSTRTPRLGRSDPVAAGVDRLIADPQIRRHIGDLAAGLDQVQHLSPELRRIATSPLYHPLKIKWHKNPAIRLCQTRGRPKSPDTPGRFRSPDARAAATEPCAEASISITCPPGRPRVREAFSPLWSE